MTPLKFKLTIAYDGGGYQGWQVQKTGTGIQEKVEEALAGCSRANRGSTVRAARIPVSTPWGWWPISRCREPNAGCPAANCLSP